MGISIIWKAVMQLMSLIWEGITWRIHLGTLVRIGEDPWIRCGNAHRLPNELKNLITALGITHINHIANGEHSIFAQQAWKFGHALQIPQPWMQYWVYYIVALTESHIRILEGEDELILAPAKHKRYSPKEGYLVLMDSHRPQIYGINYINT